MRPPWRLVGERDILVIHLMGRRAMMGKRQAAFRADYRQRISPWYNGWAHVALIYAIGGATIWYAAAADRGAASGGVAGGAGRVPALQPLRMVDPPLHHASAGGRLHGHLQAPHAGAPPVLHRRRAGHRRQPRLPHHLLSALRARHLHRDVRRRRGAAGAGLVGECGMAADLHHRRRLPQLRAFPLVLPCARRPAGAAHSRSSTPSAATISPITIRRS